MKLSMWTLCGWLERCGMTLQAAILEESACVSRARLLDGDSDSGEDLAEVVIGIGREGGPEGAAVLLNGKSKVVLPGADRIRVCNELVRAFEFYNDWERQLLTGLLEESSLQELLDMAHTVFCRPMFIKSSSGWAFAITGGYDGAVHPDWLRLQESVSTHQSSLEAVRAVSLDPEFQKTFQGRYPTIQESPFYGGPVLHANVWAGEQRVCEIVAIENGKPFNPGDAHLMHEFASVVERYMAKQQGLYLSQAGLSALFVEMIENQECNVENLQLAWEAAGWSAEDSLAVIAVGAHAEGETPIISVLREQLSGELPYGCVFTYGGKVVCIVNLTKSGGRQALTSSLAGLIPKDMFTWGMSYEFSGAEQMPEYYRQSLLVQKRAAAAGRPWQTMYQVALDVIQDRLSGLAEVQTMIHPDIRRLAEMDHSAHSKYLQTLFEFLLCGGNYTDAAHRLGLHRNSLIYRISRIEEVLATDLNDMQNRKLLIVSLLLLRGGGQTDELPKR